MNQVVGVSDANRILGDGVLYNLEHGKKIGDYAELHQYLETHQDDLPYATVAALRAQFRDVNRNFAGMKLGRYDGKVFEPLNGLPEHAQIRETLSQMITAMMGECEVAVRTRSGFGRYAQRQLVDLER